MAMGRPEKPSTYSWIDPGRMKDATAEGNRHPLKTIRPPTQPMGSVSWTYPPAAAQLHVEKVPAKRIAWPGQMGPRSGERGSC